MDGGNLGVLIVASVSVIRLIQLLIRTVMMINGPNFDYMNPERKTTAQPASTTCDDPPVTE
jgi:hypothetical protein